jgi:predicted nuclease of predicted toxin-antitoxin system
MKFLLDQDVYACTARFLAALGHDVSPAADRGLSRADDELLLSTASAEGSLLVTRDRDYGGLVFVRRLSGGVLYLRMTPATVSAVHAELATVLQLHEEKELRRAFVVIQPGQHRLRKLPP